ncbi:MAG: ATP-binding protein [bacterium]|nr:ATP-binding protein [bacterium]
MGLFSKKTGSNASNGLAKRLQIEKLKSDIIIAAIIDGVALVDNQGTIQVFNNAATRTTGWLGEEAIGLSYSSVLQFSDDKGEPIAPTDNPLAKFVGTKESSSNIMASLRTKSGGKTTIDMSVSPLTEGNEVHGSLIIFRDVSEQHSDEKRRADFISTASHEMRTPVAAIEGYLALALNSNVSKIDEKARGFLEKAHSSTQHLGTLFQDLLTSAKAEDGRLSNHPTVVEMGDFVGRLADDLKFSASKKGLKMEFIIGSQQQAIDATNTSGSKVIKPLYYVYVDADRIREVITNLFDNAVKYTDSGSVRLGLSGNDNLVQVHIADTGHGIAQEDIPHLFQKFYRVDNSATRTIGGTGLGLFICKKIVELYSGKIWVESVIGKGSTFYINLPRVSSAKAESLQQKASMELPTMPQPLQKI